MRVFTITLFFLLLIFNSFTSIASGVVCDEPTQHALGTITTTSAQVMWFGASPNATYNVQFDSAGFALGSGTIVTGLTDSSYTITGLSTDESHEIYVQAYCSANDTSEWYGPIFFHTVCPPQPGDDFNNPIVVTSLPYADANRSLCYSNQYNNPNGYFAPDVVYQITTSNNNCAAITASLCGGTNYDAYLYLLDSQNFLKTEDDDGCAMPGQFGTPAEIVDFPVLPNETYYLIVSGYDVAGGDYTLNITETNRNIDLTGGSTDATVLGGNDGTAYVMANGGMQPYTYAWNTGATTSSVTGLSAGIYTVTVTDATGCTNTSQIEVGEPCPANLSLTMSGINGTDPSTGSVSVTVGGGMPPYHYIWSTGDTTSSVSNLPSFGTYFVTVTDANGCSDQSGFTLTETNRIEALKTLSIFPNPATDNLNVILELDANQEITIELLDLNGVILNEQTSSNNLQNTFSFNIRDYASGIYFLRIKDTDKVMTRKVMIVH